MESYSTKFSPAVHIYLEIGDRKIELMDLLYDTAMLAPQHISKEQEVDANTKAVLVLLVDSDEQREEVVLTERITEANPVISFSYVNSNGRDARKIVRPSLVD